MTFFCCSVVDAQPGMEAEQYRLPGVTLIRSQQFKKWKLLWDHETCLMFEGLWRCVKNNHESRAVCFSLNNFIDNTSVPDKWRIGAHMAVERSHNETLDVPAGVTRRDNVFYSAACSAWYHPRLCWWRTSECSAIVGAAREIFPLYFDTVTTTLVHAINDKWNGPIFLHDLENVCYRGGQRWLKSADELT